MDRFGNYMWTAAGYSVLLLCAAFHRITGRWRLERTSGKDFLVQRVQAGPHAASYPGSCVEGFFQLENELKIYREVLAQAPVIQHNCSSNGNSPINHRRWTKSSLSASYALLGMVQIYLYKYTGSIFWEMILTEKITRGQDAFKGLIHLSK